MVEDNLTLTDYLAIYASFISTIVLIWNIRKSIPRCEVRTMFGGDDSGASMTLGVYVCVSNPSPHTVHLEQIELLYRYKEASLIEKLKYSLKYWRTPATVGWVHASFEDKCPVSLESGKSHKVFVPNDVLEKILADSIDRCIKAAVRDELSRNKYAKEFHYPPNGIVTK